MALGLGISRREGTHHTALCFMLWKQFGVSLLYCYDDGWDSASSTFEKELALRTWRRFLHKEFNASGCKSGIWEG
jgi:hypothetical protein